MSVCTFIASDAPLAEAAPVQDYPVEMNIDDGTIYDGGADDNYFLYFFQDVQNYTGRKNGVYLEWYYTEGRAKNIIEYIKNALENTVSIDELTAKHIREIDEAEIWNTPDPMYPDRPSFYCLEIKRP